MGRLRRKAASRRAPGTLSDEEALKQAKLSPTDGEKLLNYLKQRTLSDADQGRINDIIERFGADDFDERVKATEEIEPFGPAAIGPLKNGRARRRPRGRVPGQDRAEEVGEGAALARSPRRPCAPW